MEQVSKEMMEELATVTKYLNPIAIREIVVDGETNGLLIGNYKMPETKKWYDNETKNNHNTRYLQLKLIKHIWLDEPQFEVEKPKKWIVRSKERFTNVYFYLTAVLDNEGFLVMQLDALESEAFKFDIRAEAEEYSTPQTEVVEVEE